MRLRTLIALAWGLFNSIWLCWVFVMLLKHGSIVVSEPVRWIAGIEILVAGAIALLSLERLINLRERR